MPCATTSAAKSCSKIDLRKHLAQTNYEMQSLMYSIKRCVDSHNGHEVLQRDKAVVLTFGQGIAAHCAVRLKGMPIPLTVQVKRVHGEAQVCAFTSFIDPTPTEHSRDFKVFMNPKYFVVRDSQLIQEE